MLVLSDLIHVRNCLKHRKKLKGSTNDDREEAELEKKILDHLLTSQQHLISYKDSAVHS